MILKRSFTYHLDLNWRNFFEKLQKSCSRQLSKGYLTRSLGKLQILLTASCKLRLEKVLNGFLKSFRLTLLRKLCKCHCTERENAKPNLSGRRTRALTSLVNYSKDSDKKPQSSIGFLRNSKFHSSFFNGLCMIHDNTKPNLSAAKSRPVARHPKILESLLTEQVFHPKKPETLVSFLKDLTDLDKSSKLHLERSPRTFDTPSTLLRSSEA